MERPEITDGLKNAVERGYSIEIAVSSFISAGYNKQDVLDSAKFLGGSILTLEPKIQPSQQVPQQTTSQQIPQIPQQTPQTQQIPQQLQQQSFQQSQQTIQSQMTSPQSSQFPPLIPPRNPQSNLPQQQNQQPATVNVTIQNQPQVTRKRGWGVVILLIVILFSLLGVLLTVIFAGDFVRELLAKIGLEF